MATIAELEAENAKLKEAVRRQFTIMRELARVIMDLDPAVKELAELAFKRMPAGEMDPRAPEAVLMAKAFRDGHTAGHKDTLARVRTFSEAVAAAIEEATTGPLTRERLAMLATVIRERAGKAPPTN